MKSKIKCISTKLGIEIEDIAIDGDKIFFSSCEFNGLFCYDKKIKQVFFLGCFLDEKKMEKRLYSQILRVEKKIITIPSNARNIGIYNIVDKEFKAISIQQDEIRDKYWGHLIYHDKIYMFPFNGKGLLCFDINDFSLRRVLNFDRVLNGEKILNADLWEGVIYAPIFRTGYIITYDIRRDIGKKICIDSSALFSDVAFDMNGNMYISCCDATIVYNVNIVDFTFDIWDYGDVFYCNENIATTCFVYDGFLYIQNYYDIHYICIDLTDKNKKNVYKIEDCKSGALLKCIDGKVYQIPFNGFDIYELQFGKNYIREKITISEVYGRYMKFICFDETEKYMLKDYCESLKSL